MGGDIWGIRADRNRWGTVVIGPDVARRGARDMFSVAVKGYGIVIWDGGGVWRTFGANESLSATLAARVEFALASIPGFADEHDIREALLSISGAGLLSADCEHGPGECDEDTSFS